MEEIALLPVEDDKSFGAAATPWYLDMRVWMVLKKHFWSNLLGSHPIMSIWYHTPGDYFSAHQRLAVTMCTMITYLGMVFVCGVCVSE